MCVSPSTIYVERGPKWEAVPVACKQCWRCRKNRVDDYVGRALCEASTSLATLALTLTYRPRADGYDRFLHVPHFQHFIKRLRRRGHSLRYLAAGEYGALRDRAHFHVLLFFRGMVASDQIPSYDWGHEHEPDLSAPLSALLPNSDLVHIREWPHGHVVADWQGGQRAIRYVCKYLLDPSKKQGWFTLSKKPPLGAEFFALRAARYLEMGAMPSALEYVPPGMDRPVPMTGATRRDFLKAIGVHLHERSRLSEWVSKAAERVERQIWLDEIAVLEKTTDWAAVYAARAETVEPSQYLPPDEAVRLLSEAKSGVLRWSVQLGKWVQDG